MFSAKVEAVRVDALVTERDNGPAIVGLGPSDFEVYDNGVLQQVDLVSFDEVPLNVILTLDMSDSVAGERLDHLRGAGAALLAALKKEDQAALVTFSQLVALGAGLTKDVTPVRRAIDEAAGSGDTALVDGTYAAITLGESDAGRALVIVFSDGVDTVELAVGRGGPRRGEAIGRRGLCGVDAVASEARIPSRRDVADRRTAVRGRENGNPGGDLCRRARRVSTKVSDQLHAARRGKERLAPAGSAAERAAGDHQSPARLPGGQFPGLALHHDDIFVDPFLGRRAPTILRFAKTRLHLVRFP